MGGGQVKSTVFSLQSSAGSLTFRTADWNCRLELPTGTADWNCRLELPTGTADCRLKKEVTVSASFLLKYMNPDYFLAALMADCAAESLAIGTLKGEQLT